MVRIATAAFIAPLLAGCAGMGPTAAAPCYVHRSSWNAWDQNVIIQMDVMNVNRWCGVSVTVDRRLAETAGRIVSQPSHGRARIRILAGGAAQAEYLPTRGFVGDDSYRASLGGPGQVITINVSVQSPPHPS